ncbi:FtsK/SpoIIIE domain-containing protein [Humidisolicoccus flavus]|uniref:FtsK/SpoIIIE domain-containing protein n=1 Tax=Humidisolicoccus flavus TaxID=3111414 RepID=UPI00325544B7
MAFRVTFKEPMAGSEAKSWLLKVDDATTVGEVAESIGVAPGVLADVSASTPIGQSGLLSGQVIPQIRRATLSPGTLRLEVVGGPFAGETVRVEPESPIRLGSGAAAHVRIADAALLEVHATLLIEASKVHETTGRRTPLRAVVTPASAEADVWVNGEAIDGPHEIVPADLLQIGSSILRIGVAPASDADLTTDSPGARGFNRPSRIEPSKKQPVVPLPGDKPEDADQSPLPWLSAVIPVILGVTMAFVFNRPIMLMMAAASPIMVIGSFLTNKKLAKKKGLKTEAQWIEDIKKAGKRIAGLVKEQRLTAWYRHPDPVVIRDIAVQPLSRLWERRKNDDDALQLRVGVTDVALDVAFEGGGKDRSSSRRVGVAPASVPVDFRTGVVGIAGQLDAVRNTARAMLTSFATLRSPRDAEVMVICDDDSKAEWSWMQWLPHAHMSDAVPALIGNTEDTRRERLREAAVLLETRMRSAGQRGITFDTDLIIVVDGARRFRMLPGMVPLLEHGAEFGIHILALDSDRARLPEEAKSVVSIDPVDASLARLETSADYYPTVLLDGVSVDQAEEIARSLCSLQHVSGVGDEAMLPTSVRMVDLLGIDLDDPSVLVQRWQRSPRNTFVVVGANADGEFALDISRDGPHALVAGTTGSGKSEFLQALVISLAMANRPDALNFVLVDYKGGSAFADCERLPHTVGMVTNLDARETERALASLDAELKRRERVLRDMGAKDVDSAWARDTETAARRGLARLMIVIDEFAELKTELPEFIDGLVRIARVGRSLGVNLVLATQRPSGVVTAEMQSNINLRVALRVTDRADSSDIIGSSEAALISSSTPGRGYVRLGPSAMPAGFQTARVAGIRPGTQRVLSTVPPKAPLDWESLGFPAQYPKAQSSHSTNTDHDDTDLRALVNLVTAATNQLGIQKNPSPWLLPLPTVLPLEKMQGENLGATEILLGLEDVPEEQSQRTLTWDVASGSHLLFMGGALSGRTTALRTTLAQLVQRFSPADLHLYALDFGNGALLPLADVQHCGAVITALDSDRLPRLVQRLLEELSARQTTLSSAGVGNINEQRRKAEPHEALPYLVLALDGWERMLSSMNPDQLVIFRDQMMRILREGPAVGVRVLMTGDRGVGGDKVAAFIDTQYVLPMRDINDYRTAGIIAKDIPLNLQPGRALFGPQAAEAQLAVLDRDTSGEAQTAAFRRTVEFVHDHFSKFEQLENLPQPFHVDPLPSYMALSAAYDLPLAPGLESELPIVGVGGDKLSKYTLDWPDAGGFVVTGPRRSGRSSALAAIVHQMAWNKIPVLVVATRASVLTEVAEGHKVPIIRESETAPDGLQEVLAQFEGKITIVVDDAEQLKNAPLEHALAGVKHRAVFIASAESDAVSTLFGGAFAEAKRARHAIVLRPIAAMLGTQAVGSPIPKFMLGQSSAGGGVLYTGSEWIPVRVPDIRQ